jgi:sec-independent protein translocase protein TatC
VAITTTVSFAFAKQIFDILTFRSPFLKPIFDFLTTRLHLFAPPNLNLIAIELTEMIGTYMRVCLIVGVILAMPYLIFEVVNFVSPALSQRERRRYIYTALPWVGMMFIVGVVFTYFILLPPALRFLTTFGSDIATIQVRIGNYITIISRLLLAVGLIFEMPVLTTFLAWIGVVTWRWLANKRKWAFIGAFLVGALVTPTLDPINQTLVAVPIILLYELSIWTAWLVQRRKRARA